MYKCGLVKWNQISRMHGMQATKRPKTGINEIDWVIVFSAKTYLWTSKVAAQNIDGQTCNFCHQKQWFQKNINIWSKHKTDTWHLGGIQIMCVGLVDDYLRNYAIFYCVNFWTVILSIFKWLSIMLNSSCGDGIRPVSSLDHAGISFIEISNAPEAISCREKIYYISISMKRIDCDCLRANHEAIDAIMFCLHYEVLQV